MVNRPALFQWLSVLAALTFALLSTYSHAQDMTAAANVRATNIQVTRAHLISECKKAKKPADMTKIEQEAKVDLDQNAFCSCVGERLMKDKRINGLIAGQELALNDDALDQLLKARALSHALICMGQQLDEATSK